VINGSVHLSRAGQIADQQWLGPPARFPETAVDIHVVMPNHVHGIVVLRAHEILLDQPGISTAPALSEVVRTFKAATSIMVRRAGTPDFGWQTGYYDHIIRSDKDYNNVYAYIEANPDNWQSDEERNGSRQHRGALARGHCGSSKIC
jgi:putative transposase